MIKPFAALKEVSGKRGAAVRERTKALLAFLEELGLEDKLFQRAEELREAGDPVLASEYDQVYGLITDLLDRTEALLGEEKVSRAAYADILDAGFGEIKIGLIPAVFDRVVIGDITRTRLNGIKVLFFAGLNDGVVPKASGGGGILSDQERRRLREQNVELAPTLREDGFLQRFYLYLAMTKPSERLYLSWHASSADGKVTPQSSLVGQVMRLFPEKKVMRPDSMHLALWSEAAGLRILSASTCVGFLSLLWEPEGPQNGRQPEKGGLFPLYGQGHRQGSGKGPLRTGYPRKRNPAGKLCPVCLRPFPALRTGPQRTKGV